MTDEQLGELQRYADLGRLLAGVAHELSAPIAALLSNADTEIKLLQKLERSLANQPPDNGPALVGACKELVAVDQSACERIRALVKSLKTASRKDSGEFELVNVNEILDAMLHLAKTQFHKGITVETDFGELPEVACHPHLLSQVFLNLLTNAGQAIDGTGTISVGTRAEGDQAHIWIRDTGRGISAADKPKILTRGFTTKPVGVGTGLGLTIVRQNVVAVHHGTIDFESELGTSTTFNIRIPISQRKGA